MGHGRPQARGRCAPGVDHLSHAGAQRLEWSAPEITGWLAHPRRRRRHLRFTPTSSSWVNLVQRWFKELTDKQLRGGVFTRVADRIAAIETWVAHWNGGPKRFICHAPAAQIIEKVERGRAALHHIKSTTDR
jgi:hypothetical protein